MSAILKSAAIGTAVVLMLCVDLDAQAPRGVRFIADAQAIVGLPFTPLSVAGVARRTAVRTTAVATTAAATSTAAAQQQAAASQQQAAAAQQQAAAAAAATPPPPPPAAPAAAAGQPLPVGTVVPALPAGCVSTPVGGVDYFYCGGNFYRAAFQGNNLVYVTAKP